MSTIRLRLFKVAALVVVSTRRVLLRLASGFPLRELFAGVLRLVRGCGGGCDGGGARFTAGRNETAGSG